MPAAYRDQRERERERRPNIFMCVTARGVPLPLPWSIASQAVHVVMHSIAPHRARRTLLSARDSQIYLVAASQLVVQFKPIIQRARMYNMRLRCERVVRTSAVNRTT